LQIAEEDAELDWSIGEINWAYADEIGLSVNSVDSEKVRKLLQENFLSVFSESIEISPITVGEVTAHLIANQLVPPADQENSLKLLHINIPLPKWLSLP